MQLRPYQQQADQRIVEAWREHRNVLAVLPTGAGKTVLFGHRIREHSGASVAIAHRQELVGQISIALARESVRHRIIGPSNVVRWVNQLHMIELGTSFYDPGAQCAVAGVDTLLRRADHLNAWRQQVTLWVQDEAHHVLKANKWGKAADLFPNARGLGVTATPVRADGKGLGAHADGLFNTMIEGPSMRALIDAGYLTDYRIFAPPSDLNLDGVSIGANGDYSAPQLKKRVQQSHVVGDVVAHYMKLAAGLLGVVFATDVETATEIAGRFNASGIPAEVVSAKTPDRIRQEILGRFRRKELRVLVNVDLFGEGFDLPAIEVVMMARPTQSYALYAQQFGRALRILDGKQIALIIDHVGNVARHGLPDAARVWSLDRREKRSNVNRDPDVLPVKTCDACTAVYEVFHKACPYCGHVIVPLARSGPEFVDGDLAELDAATLAKMRGEVDRIDAPVEEIRRKMKHAHAPDMAILGAVKQHGNRQAAQVALRASMAWWGGYQKHLGRDLREAQVRFYHAFGVDVMSAQALGRPDAEKLKGQIDAHIEKLKSEVMV